MDEQLDRLDFGARSNESIFGTLGENKNKQEAAARRDDIRPRVIAFERLPFTLGVVDSEAMLLRVQALRVSAYGHHLPGGMAAAFGQPDVVDRLDGVTIFYAEDKATGRLVGSARIQSNRLGPLQIERSLVLPKERQDQLLGEVTRLTVLPGYLPPVRLALVKALHLFCIATQTGGVVVGSRRSLLRIYFSLGFSDLYGDDRLVPLAHGGGLEHRILFRDTVTSEAHSSSLHHPDHGFVFRTYHPDITVFKGLERQTSLGLAARTFDAPYSSKAA